MFTEREWQELCRLHEMLPWSSWGGRRAHILERKLVEEAGKPEIIVQKGGRPMETLEQREQKLREKLERLSQSKFPVIQKHAGKCLQLLARVQKEGGEKV